MSLELRDFDRYGLFEANSDIGEVIIDICISGFGEGIIIIKDKKILCDIDTLDNEEDYYETNEYIDIEHVRVYKPFIKCLKRYE